MRAFTRRRGCVRCWVVTVTHMVCRVPPDRRVNSQSGYEVKHRDVPFGERFKVQFK